MRNRLLLVSGVVAMLLVLASCGKDQLITNSSAKLEFSADTVYFDTVFTEVGSITKLFRVYNRNKGDVEISSIFLAGGEGSNYRMNVDGEPGTVFQDVLLREGDSIWVFVEVTIDPNNANDPMILTDSVVFETNGNIQDIDLVGWGQDAYVYPAFTRLRLTDGTPFGPPIWADTNDAVVHMTNEKPHLIYGYLFLDSGQTLLVDPGTQIHFHNGSGIWAFPGSQVIVNGTVDEPAVFQGDRLDPGYEDIPGQWDRIWLNESERNHRIENAVIRNAFIGIQAESLISDRDTELKLHNVKIENMTGIGLFSRNFHIVGRNTAVTNCSNYCVALTNGGSYDFRHCTFANFWRFDSRENALFFLSNFMDIGNQRVVTDLENAYFGNCIIHGSIDEELELEDEGSVAFNYLFDNCIVKTLMETDDPDHFLNITKNPADVTIDGSFQNGVFRDITEDDYRLWDGSAARDLGDVAIMDTLTTDFFGVDRSGSPDLGAYEYSE